MHRSLLALVVAASAGCSLLVDTSGLFSDATMPSNEAAAADARPSSDADLGVDTAVAVDASAPDARFVCSDASTFCDTFDDGPLGARWDKQTMLAGGTLSLTPSAFSAPWALELDLPARTGGTTERAAVLSKTLLASSAGAVSCRFQMNVTVAPTAPGDDFAVFLIEPLPTPNDHIFEMKVSSGLLSASENFAPDAGVDMKNAFGVPKVGTWVLIELSLDLAAKTMTASVDGASKTFPVTDMTGTTSLRVSLAETGDSDDAHMAARFDDFECTVK